MIYQTYYNLKTDGFRWFILSQDIITHENWYLCIHILEIYLYIKNCCKEEVKGSKIGTFPEW
jgi:hypothetical protein